jgi:hypothetical protein
MQRPLHDNPNCILCGVQTIKLINKQYSAVLCYFLLLRTNYLPQSPVTNTPGLYSSLNVRDHLSDLYERRDKTVVRYTSIFTFLDSKLEDKTFQTE